MKSIFLMLVFCFICVPTFASYQQKSWSLEPDFSQIMQAAYHNEKLTWSEFLHQIKKMKKAPWLPTFYAGLDHSLKETQSAATSDNISVTSGGVVVGPTDSDWDQTLNVGTTLRLRAVWRLDELVFSSNNISMLREKSNLLKNRQNLRSLIFKIYTQRKKLIQKYTVSHSKQISGDINLLTEFLHEITGGSFYNKWRILK